MYSECLLGRLRYFYYFILFYSDEAAATRTTEIVCESDNTGLAIQCPVGQKISILEGFYGRTNNNLCKPVAIRNNTCRDGVSEAVVSIPESPEQAPPVKASIYAIDILAFTGGAC